MRLVLGVLAARHQRGGLVERLLERGAARVRVLEERLAEPGELTVVLAAKGGVRGIGCGNDRRGVALELVEKDTRVAGHTTITRQRISASSSAWRRSAGASCESGSEPFSTSSPSCEPCEVR